MIPRRNSATYNGGTSWGLSYSEPCSRNTGISTRLEDMNAARKFRYLVQLELNTLVVRRKSTPTTQAAADSWDLVFHEHRLLLREAQQLILTFHRLNPYDLTLAGRAMKIWPAPGTRKAVIPEYMLNIGCSSIEAGFHYTAFPSRYVVLPCPALIQRSGIPNETFGCCSRELKAALLPRAGPPIANSTPGAALSPRLHLALMSTTVPTVTIIRSRSIWYPYHGRGSHLLVAIL